MSRHYVIQDWSSSAEWSGEMIGSRLSKSVGHHFLKNGKANIGLYEGEESKKTKKQISIRDRILPGERRVITLTNQMRELVLEYQKGNIDIDEYSMLLSVVSQKRSRAMELLAKAKSVRAPFEIEEEGVISLGKTHVKSGKSFKTSKRIATEGNRFKEPKKPAIRDNLSSDRTKLSRVLDWIGKNDWFVFVSASIIVFTAAKIIF